MRLRNVNVAHLLECKEVALVLYRKRQGYWVGSASKYGWIQVQGGSGILIFESRVMLANVHMYIDKVPTRLIDKRGY